jgi:FkbM family methyltransferase
LLTPVTLTHLAIRRIARALARNRRAKWAQWVHGIILDLHKGFENLDYDFDSNGERWVLDQVSKARKVATVFDVGANRGDWTAIALEIFPGAHIHSFEIVPETYSYLRERVASSSRVFPNNIGLSDSEDTINVHYQPLRNGQATSVAGFSESFHRYQPEVLTLPVTYGDRYCSERNIDHIDFLKIDVEGLEPNVLRGFGSMLERGAIDIIQFEYGYINIDVRFLLKDFYAFLWRFDMVIGKIYPDHVEFRPYRHIDEDFFGPNFLAVRAEHRDVIAALESRTPLPTPSHDTR